MPDTNPLYKSAEEVLSVIKSGDSVFIHGSAATPQYLLQKLTERAAELRNVELVSISTFGDMPCAEEQYTAR